MRSVAKILGVIALVNLLIAGVGALGYYVIEFISSFFISTINMVEIGNVFWKIIFVCFVSAVCSFVISYIISKKHE